MKAVFCLQSRQTSKSGCLQHIVLGAPDAGGWPVQVQISKVIVITVLSRRALT